MIPLRASTWPSRKARSSRARGLAAGTPGLPSREPCFVSADGFKDADSRRGPQLRRVGRGYYPIAARAFGRVERIVAALQKSRRAIFATRKRRGNADAECDLNSRGHIRRDNGLVGDGMTEPLGDCGCHRDRCLRHHHYKFLAAVARHKVERPDVPCDTLRDLAEHGVAGGMSVSVVDQLE